MLREVAWSPKYVVSDDGKVFRKRRNELRELRPWSNKGYLIVCLSYRRRAQVHRLVAEAFVPNPLGMPVVRHLDGDPRNNASCNLAWGTYADNSRDTDRHGRQPHGSKCHLARLTESDVGEIKAAIADGMCLRAIARAFGVAPSTIVHIRDGDSWRRVQPTELRRRVEGRRRAERLSDEERMAVRALAKAGMRTCDISLAFGIATTYVRMLATRAHGLRT